MANKSSKRKMYRRRRIIGIIVLILFIALIIFLIKSLTKFIDKKRASNSVDESFQRSEEISKEEKILLEIINTDPIAKHNNQIVNYEKARIKSNEDVKSYLSLLPYRQQKIRDHSMSKNGIDQSLLKKQVFLTFDDGPSSEATNQILDTLKTYNIKATFFIIGKNAENYPDILRRVYEEGHEIAIHTYSHDYKDIYSHPDNLQRDIERCFQAVRNIIGEDFHTSLYRFPGGSYRKDKEIFIKRIEEMGLVYFDWNVLNGDAEGKNPSEEYLVKRFEETSEGYNVIVSLMHDTNDKTNTVKTLPRIIENLLAEGYEFKTLGDI